MTDQAAQEIARTIDELYRTDSRRIFATLIRLLGDFELAEEALNEAFAAALQQWPRDGAPANPRAWLVSTGRFKGIDAIRRRVRFDSSLTELIRRIDESAGEEINEVEDDRLRLIFTCCHPALPANAQVPMTLREVCGLKTEEIARAFLTAPSAIAQRIVRAKSKIRAARIPYVIPSADDLPERLESVLSVVYLLFNEGYSASGGESLIRADLTAEAIRLGRLIVELLPDPEAIGLLALMLLQESRRRARMSAEGDLILLEDQDRSLWNRDQILEGVVLANRALASEIVGPYTIQAAIASVHAQAESTAATDWNRIVAYYDLLLRINPSPIIELNRAVAVAMRDGAERGLTLVDDILQRNELERYHLAHAARADLCRRLGKLEQAKDSYRRALELAQLEPERRFLQMRLQQLDER